MTSAHAAIREYKGDLFACPTSSSLAHCVSRDLRMGAGVSVEFKRRYGKVDELAKQNVGVGSAAVLDVSDVSSKKFVYYLVTKEHCYDKPTYGTLTESLWAMRNHAVAHGVKTISMPRIGCGLDKLEWSKVKALLSELFKDTDISICVYVI